MTHKVYADSLRQIADFFEAHPEVKLPPPEFKFYQTSNSGEVAAFAKAFGSCTKRYEGDFFYLTKKFGALTVEVIERRQKICVKKVVGHKTVIVERPIAFETFSEEQEIVEWECQDASLLKTKDLEEPASSTLTPKLDA